MTRVNRRIALAALVALPMLATSAYALEPNKDGYYLTGNGVRVKTVALMDFKVYAISHYMKQLPEAKTKQAVLEADVDKKFVWKMLRDVEKDKVQGAIRDAFAMNNYADNGKIEKYLGAFANDLKEDNYVNIAYSADRKAVTVTVQGGGSATIEGVDFMRAVWSIYFGKIDQPKLSDALISKLQ